VSDILQEVQEEYRREQMAKLWEKYRVAIVSGVSVLILGVAGFQAWSYWHASEVEKSSRALEAASDLVSAENGQEKEAVDRLVKLAASGTSGYRMVAELQAAALKAQLGDVKGALALYDSVSASQSDPLFRDYAQIRASILIVDVESLDNIKKRLGSIAAGNGPWNVMAKEFLAYASWRSGKTEDALKLYAEVQAAPDAVAGSKRRALEMSSLINGGLKISDLTPASSPFAVPAGGAGPMLLQPKTPEPSDSLLGPDPIQPPTP
jgi:hypothetical protein